MIKTFVVGVVLGALLVAAAAYFVPLADLHRESSMISVLPNGGNAEQFYIEIPGDRLVAGGADPAARVPDALDWPRGSAVEAEVFKLRNRNNAVVGVASRVAGRAGGIAAVEWLLHLPARGSLYFPMATEAAADGMRRGNLRAGTGEFLDRAGFLQERYEEVDSDAVAGRIDLRTIMISTAVGEGE